jgi:outer membrane protein assembly factor BamD
MTPHLIRPFKAILFLVTFLGLGSLLVACESTDETDYAEQSAESIYNKAVNELFYTNYVTAANLFDEVERQHPYSVWATKGQLMAAFARYKKNEYDGAIIGLDRFISLHPGHVDVPYAYYLKALCYYERITDVSRDQRNTELALEAFEEVAIRFPYSKYVEDVLPKLDLILDHLAGKDMTIGRYYLQREHYLSAINRFRSVVEKYKTTTHIPESLHRLVESYLALGMVSEARKAAAVLGYNHPNNPWYIDTYTLLEDNDLLKEHETFKSEVKRRALLDKKEGKKREKAGEKEDKSYFSHVWDWVF